MPSGFSTRSWMRLSNGWPVAFSISRPSRQKLVLLYWNAVPGSDCSTWPSALSAACCQVSTPWPKKIPCAAPKPDMCDSNCRTVIGGDPGVGERSVEAELAGERLVEFDRALVDQLHDRHSRQHLRDAREPEPVVVVAAFDSKRVLHAERRRVQHLSVAQHRSTHRDVADIDGRSGDHRVERGPLNAPCDCGTVVVVDGGVVVDVVVVDSVVVVSAMVVVVDVGGVVVGGTVVGGHGGCGLFGCRDRLGGGFTGRTGSRHERDHGNADANATDHPDAPRHRTILAGSDLRIGGTPRTVGNVPWPVRSALMAERPTITIPDSEPPADLVIEDETIGDGDEAVVGKRVSVHYAGVAWSNGQEFDASWNRGDLFDFRLGAREVIEGWDKGVAGMRVGGRRRLTIPPHLGYGSRGAGGVDQGRRDPRLRRRPRQRPLARSGAVAALAGGESGRALTRFSRANRCQTEFGLVGHRFVEASVPTGRSCCDGPSAGIAGGARRSRWPERPPHRGPAPWATSAVGQAHAHRLLARHAAAGQDHVERVAVPDEAGESHGAAVDQRHAPSPAVDAEHRVGRQPRAGRTTAPAPDHRRPRSPRPRRSPACRAACASGPRGPSSDMSISTRFPLPDPICFRSAPAQNVPPRP